MNNFNRLLEGIHRTPKPISKAKMKELRKKYKLSPSDMKKMLAMDSVGATWPRISSPDDYLGMPMDLQKQMDYPSRFKDGIAKELGRVRINPRVTAAKMKGK